MNRRLLRSRTDRMIGGVCGGLAQYFGLDSSALRVISALLILFGGMSVWVYLILWLVIPEE
ncbi:MAG: PspC domain-containing protein [Alistipes sp.]|nr:PspC domain-containing protein [Alistipes sp.]